MKVVANKMMKVVQTKRKKIILRRLRLNLIVILTMKDLSAKKLTKIKKKTMMVAKMEMLGMRERFLKTLKSNQI